MPAEAWNIIWSVVGIVATGLVSWATTALVAWLNTKIKNEKAAKWASDLTSIVSNAVLSVTQTFVDAMNKKAEELGLDAVFANPHGLDFGDWEADMHASARDVAKAHRPSLVELDERHRVAAIARRGDDAVESRHVAGAGDVEHAQAYAAVLPAAQGPAGEAWVEAELIHGVLDALACLLDDARLIVHHARDRLARDARQARDVRHRHRAGSAPARRRTRLSCYRPPHSGTPSTCSRCTGPLYHHRRRAANAAHGRFHALHRPPHGGSVDLACRMLTCSL